jgi:hypothetical protein
MANVTFLKLSDKQMEVLCEALESFSRAKLGQFSYALEHVKFTSHDTNKEIDSFLKEKFFPELKGNTVFGIHSDEVSDDARIAYDIQQVLRNHLAWKDHPEGGYTVNFNTPMRTSKDEKMPKIFDLKDKK